MQRSTRRQHSPVLGGSAPRTEDVTAWRAWRTGLAALLGAVVLASLPAIAAADCGGSVCSCGDTVTSDYALQDGVDPVCSSSAAESCATAGSAGLIVAAGVTLDLGGCTLRGPGDVGSVGIDLDAGAAVQGGKIIGFGLGIQAVVGAVTLGNIQVLDADLGIHLRGNGHRVTKSVVRRSASTGVEVAGSGNVVSKVQVSDSRLGFGITIAGDGNTVERSIFGRNAFGVAIDGDANTVTRNRVEDNSGPGIRLDGAGNIASRNVVERNACFGLVLAGTAAVAQRNQVRANGCGGFRVSGSGHRLQLNISDDNVADPGGSGIGDGYDVSGSGHVFDRNRATSNEGFGIEDGPFGLNTYTRNICRANILGASSPPGLCS